MKQATTERNERTQKKQGYPEVTLIGWAQKPSYDKASHKLYWAREYSVEGVPQHSLNYDVRVLGRNGVLVMSMIGGMDQLPMIEANKSKILSFVEYNPTHRYSDFNADTDKVAAYGMAALVAGFAAAKVGLF